MGRPPDLSTPAPGPAANRPISTRALRAVLPVLLASGLLAAGTTLADPGPRGRLIVKFESQGPHALEECAETLFRKGRAFAADTRDGSGSLDALQARLGVRGIRAVFRRPDGRPLAEQRARLKGALGRKARGGGSRGDKRTDRRLPDLSHVYVVETAAGVSPETALALYAADPHVAWVQRDHTQKLDTLPAEPNDPFFASRGSWNQAFDDLWGLHRVRAPEAWSMARGAGVVVAVVDTGLDYLHPDIADNVWVNPGEDLDGNGRVDLDDFFLFADRFQRRVPPAEPRFDLDDDGWVHFSDFFRFADLFAEEAPR